MKRQRIVIVDRDADTAEMYALGLRLAGFHAAVALDSADAIACARRQRPGAIVLEAYEAADDDWRLVRDIKSDPATRPAKIVILTGRADPSLAIRCRELSCAAFILKPCLPNELAAILRDVLEDPKPRIEPNGNGARTTPRGRTLYLVRSA